MTSAVTTFHYRFFLPILPPAPHLRVFEANDGAFVQVLKDQAYKRWVKALKGVDEDEVFLLKCDDIPCESLETHFERILIWLRKRSVHDAMIEGEKLSKYFPDGPAREEDKKIDIIIATTAMLEAGDEVPELPELPNDPTLPYIKVRRDVVGKLSNLPNPSDGVKDASGVAKSNDDGCVHAHRPAGNYGPPTAIFHPVLGKLKHFLDHLDGSLQELEPSSTVLLKSHSFIVEASELHGKEAERERLTKLLIDWLIGENGSWQETLSVSRARPDYILYKPARVILEVKYEYGIGGNPVLQATVVYAKVLREPEYEPLLGKSNCPVILVGLAGNRLEVSTAIFTDGVYVDKLLSMDLYLDTWQAENVLRLGRVFKALNACISELNEYYGGINQVTPSDQFLFPDPVPVEASAQMPNLRYLNKLSHKGEAIDVSRLEANDKRERRYANYIAEMTGTDTLKKKVVVKFVTRYNERAHRLLADQGLAPELHFYAPVLGGLSMVVMDYVDGVPLKFAKISQNNPKIYEDIEAAVKLLHANDLVFGDLRLENIILNGEGCAMLVDFDWAGRHKVDRYPATLNDGIEMTWAEGAGRWTVMVKDHDIFKLEEVKKHLQEKGALPKGD